MKRILLAYCLIAVLSSPVSAQEEHETAFKHWGVGVSVGTTAIGVNVSTTLNPYLSLRAGFNLWPKFNLGTNLHLGFKEDKREAANYKQYVVELNEKLQAGERILPTASDVIDVQYKPKLTAGHVLLDYFPFPKKSNFHLSVGAHFGRSTVIEIHNRHEGILMPITKWNEAMENPDAQEVVEQYNLRPIGVKLGSFFLAPDEAGNINARIKVHAFRPYLGLGFGRSVPHKRVGCQFDLGVQFWGSPKVKVNDEKLEPDEVGEELSDILSIVSKIKVFPVLNFRLVGRIL